MEPKYYKHKLKNGLKVLFIHHPNNKLVSIKFTSSIGEDQEKLNSKEYEIVHTLEHLFGYFTSKKYPNAKKNIFNLEKNGIQTNAEVTATQTVYNLVGHKKNFEYMFDLISNTFLSFIIDKNIFSQEKNAISQELNDILNDIWYKLDLSINKSMYYNHIRSLCQKEKKQNLKNLQINSVTNFYKKHYYPNNTCITISGDLDWKKIMSKIQANFNVLKPGNILHNNKPIVFNKELKFIKTNVLSYNLYLIFRIKINEFEPDFKLYNIISDLLTDGLNSILYKILRGKGLVYSIQSDILSHPLRKDFSYFIINTQTEKKNILIVIRLILQELYNLKKNRINDNDIILMKNKLELEYLQNNNKNKIEHYEEMYTDYYMWDQKIKNNKEKYLEYNNFNVDRIKLLCKIFRKDNMVINYGGNSNLNKDIIKIIKEFN
jgi:zinc protease